MSTVTSRGDDQKGRKYQASEIHSVLLLIRATTAMKNAVLNS
jgi:hypothetical protein